jgi:hypothetical protein
MVVDFVILTFSFFKNINFFLSSQAGFISSLLVTLASYRGYKKMVEHKVAIGDIPKEDRDEFDKIDDKFKLYDEKNQNKELDFKEVLAQEKVKIKGFKKSITNTKKSFFAFISPFRLFAYLFLTASFLYLNTHHMLDIFGFLVGISVVSLVSLIASIYT